MGIFHESSKERGTNMMGASYKTKKSLKENIGKPLRYIETSMFGSEYSNNGKFCVVGPSPYERKWYANVTVKDGIIIKVT
jgi:hypothetical protein